MSGISADLYKELLDRMSDGVYFVDRNRRIVYWNEGATRLTGYKADEVVGRSCQEGKLCHVDAVGWLTCSDSCPLLDCMDDGIPREADLFLIHKQGRRVPVRFQVQPIREANGRIVGAAEIFRDNTAEIEVRRKADAMERLAFLDPLTHQPNRRFLEMSLRTALVEFESHSDPFGVLLFDLNNFKAINDRLGHTSGDRALLEVGKTLAGALRSKDIVGRWAGDEFLAIAHNVTMQVLGELAERCVALVQAASFGNNEGGLEKLTISVGAALAEPGDDVEKLLGRADGRMYEKKNAGSVGRKGWRAGSGAAAP
jgi:diguanylate cyclase (GGDEF)-like protein/PAS domain S-box-containing protein